MHGKNKTKQTAILKNDLTCEISILQYQRDATFGFQSSHGFNQIQAFPITIRT